MRLKRNRISRFQIITTETPLKWIPSIPTPPPRGRKCPELHGARGGNRTPTARKGLGILSPVRLPVPPPGRTWKTYHKNSGVRRVVGKDSEIRGFGPEKTGEDGGGTRIRTGG